MTPTYYIMYGINTNNNIMMIIINDIKYVILFDVFSPKRFPIVFFIIFLNACPPSKGNSGKELKFARFMFINQIQ